eukprot:CAMPEP_0114591302 /NCGR_PEP_ID=MMETSP0125-20121206/13377_1 /TAXON_ID=485358 ORGANISM="Aristerostoma sp., Strain ATCC 50986" /NCGR_SAMPLE_ID=MMETSP0125 /ASSEMBLY_ACC=CAM_ASM_000245 /LENGTH=142 /DNA_ID=CAMNT_0001789307 /DNA_START=2555 /DNA_END=2980 /DNA_ORIENTATION=-
MRKMFLEIIAMSLWYDARLTFAFLAEKKMVEHVFKAWIDILPIFRHSYELKRLVFGFSAILRCNINDIPPIVLESIPGFLQEMIEICGKILELREIDEDDSQNGEEDEEEFQKVQKKIEEHNAKFGGAYKYYNESDYRILVW